MYPELPQDMGEIWHHWVRSVWPQKMGSARLAVLWPRLAKVTIDKVKNVFWLKVIFFKTSIQINFIFVVSNGQSDIAAFCRIFRAFWQINSTASWPTVPPPLFLHFYHGWKYFSSFSFLVLFCYIQGKAWCLAAMIKLISAHAAYLRSVNADFFILKIFSASLLFNGLSSFTWDWDFDLSPQSCTCNNALSGIPGTTICWWSDLPKSSRVVNSFKTRPIIHWDSSGRGVMI